MACQPFGQVARHEKKALVKNRGEKIQLLRDVERINKISPCVPIIYFCKLNSSRSTFLPSFKIKEFKKKKKSYLAPVFKKMQFAVD